MLAMPMMSLDQLPCFVEWVVSRTVCSKLKMESYFDMSGSTSFEVRRVNGRLDFFAPHSDY